MTMALMNCIKKKNNLYRKHMKTKSAATEFSYKSYKNRLVSIIRGAKKEILL